MRKIFMLMATVALVASCSKDLTNDVILGPDGQENVAGSTEGMAIVVSVEDVTRVTVEGDAVAKTSQFSWEAGDMITLVNDGKCYQFVAQTAGRTAEFLPLTNDDILVPADLTKPLAAFYNVVSVDAATMTAVYNVEANQVAGELSNKMPFYGYSETTVVENDKMVITMKPLASVVELELSASKTWNADAVALSVANSTVGTYAVASGVVVDAATGKLSLDNAKLGSTVAVSLGETVDFATARKVQLVVMGLTREVSTTAVVEGVETTITTLTAPIYHGQTALKLYKNGAENARRVIWNNYTAGTTAVDEHKHIYQVVTDVLKDKVADGISTAEQMKAFADSVNNTVSQYPAGAEFCNEDGVIVLHNDIDLSAYNWLAIGSNNDDAQITQPKFTGIFDGNNKTITVAINHNAAEHTLNFPDGKGGVVASGHHNAGLFGVVANGGVVKNLTVNGTIVANFNFVNPDASISWAYLGAVVAQLSGGTVENCTSNVSFTCGDLSNGKNRLGGIIGRAYAATADNHIKNCTNNGTINLNYTAAKDNQCIVGGVIGMIGDGSTGYTPYVDNCENKADINVFNTGHNSYVGGLIGYVTKDKEDDGLISNSTNYNSVCFGTTSTACTAFFVGGISGRVNHHQIANCVNKGAISVNENTTSTATIGIGGGIGVINNAVVDGDPAIIKSCVNEGTVTVKGVDTITNGLCCGGFVGYPRFTCQIIDCVNKGDVYADVAASSSQNFSGGFAGKIGVSATGSLNGVILMNCVNEGYVKVFGSSTLAGWHYGGGVVGCIYGGTNVNTGAGCYGAILRGCENKGTLSILGPSTSKFRCGGVTGLNNSSAIYNCTHSGVASIDRQSNVSEFIGGVVGFIETGRYALVDGCVNTGTVCCSKLNNREIGGTTSNIYVIIGGILGHGADANSPLRNCVSKGKVLAAHDGTLSFNDNGVIVTNLDVTTEYRGVLVGQGNANKTTFENCQVGGYVGSVKGGDGDDKHEPDALHKLNDTAGDTYYWKNWMQGYTSVPKYSGITFVDVE